MTAPDHDRFLRALSPEVRGELVRRRDGPGLVRSAAHGGAVALLGCLIAAGVPGWWALLLPQGILIVFLFTAMHEASHRTAFATGWLNDALARATGFLLVLPPEWFRLFHFAHHRHTQNPRHDPELASPRPETPGQYLAHLSGLPLWWGALRVLTTNALGQNRDAFVPGAAMGRIVREARVMLALYVMLALGSAVLGWKLLLWVWIVPALLGQPFLRLYLLAEHGRCPFVADMFENSRTTFTNKVVRWIAWNMPYHAEHHAFPAVPFHRLPDLHALTAPHLRTTERGYVRATARYVAGLRHGNSS